MHVRALESAAGRHHIRVADRRPQQFAASESLSSDRGSIDDGGVWGIATGTTLKRGRRLAKQFMKVEDECFPFQYALSTRAGTDSVEHMLRAATDQDRTATVLKVHGMGAHDDVLRSATLGRLKDAGCCCFSSAHPTMMFTSCAKLTESGSCTTASMSHCSGSQASGSTKVRQECGTSLSVNLLALGSWGLKFGNQRGSQFWEHTDRVSAVRSGEDDPEGG